MQRLLVHKNEMSSFQTTNDIVFTWHLNNFKKEISLLTWNFSVKYLQLTLGSYLLKASNRNTSKQETIRITEMPGTGAKYNPSKQLKNIPNDVLAIILAF